MFLGRPWTGRSCIAVELNNDSQLFTHPLYYCTISISSAGGVTCDPVDEFWASATAGMTGTPTKIRPDIWLNTKILANVAQIFWPRPGPRKICYCFLFANTIFEPFLSRLFFPLNLTVRHSRPPRLWPGTKHRFRPYPLGLWPVTAELIKMVQYI